MLNNVGLVICKFSTHRKTHVIVLQGEVVEASSLCIINGICEYDIRIAHLHQADGETKVRVTNKD
jgi:hypothetical protein